MTFVVCFLKEAKRIIRPAVLATLGAVWFTPLWVNADAPTLEAFGELKDTGVRHVSPAQASALIASHPDVVVVDVRTDREFEKSHVDGAVNVNFLSPSFQTDINRLDKDKTYLLYCGSGNRSSKALPALQEAGIQSVVHLDGGIKAWRRAGLPLAVKDD